MKPKQYLLLASIFFLLSGWTLALENRITEEQMAASIAPDVLRFHILAASDSTADQTLKLQVRDVFLSTLRNALSADAGKQDIINYVNCEKSKLESSLNSFIKNQGVSDTVNIQTANVHFPRRTYGSLTFPCGNYDTVQIYIGPAKGHNWWCVLYPSLCFTDESGPSLPASSCHILQESLEQGTYQDMLSLSQNTSIMEHLDHIETKFWIQKPFHALQQLLEEPEI